MKVVLGILLVLASCSPVKVDTAFSRQADFKGYDSFAITSGRVLTEPGVVENPIWRDELTRAIGRELVRKGLEPERQSPDLWVRFIAGARTREELETTYGPHGFVDPFGYPNVWIESYQEGTLVIDIVDARKRTVVWRAYAEARRANLRDREFLRDVAQEALAKFPPRG